MSKIKFLKIRDVKAPTRANKYDAGIDFFVPKFNEEFVDRLIEINPQFEETSFGTAEFTLTQSGTGSLTINETVEYDSVDKAKEGEKLFGYDPEKGEPYFILKPHNRVKIPAGVKCRMEKPDRALIASNKSGVSTKLGLIFSAQVVDYEYTGEVHIGIINTTTKHVKIYQNQKIMQFLETPIFTSELEIHDVKSTDFEEFYKGFESERGDGGFGSSDKKEVTQINS